MRIAFRGSLSPPDHSDRVIALEGRSPITMDLSPPVQFGSPGVMFQLIRGSGKSGGIKYRERTVLNYIEANARGASGALTDFTDIF